MKQTKAQTTMTTEPENYGLGLTKQEVQNLHTFTMIALAVALVAMGISAVFEMGLKYAAYLRFKAKMKKSDNDLKSVLQELEKTLTKKPEGVN